MSSIYFLSFIITTFFIFLRLTSRLSRINTNAWMTLYVHLCVKDFLATALSFAV